MNSSSLVYNKLVVAIVLLIGFQQFPVVRIGGSYKIYELIASFLLLVYIIQIGKIKIANSTSLLAFVFFVVSPLISLILFYFNLENVGLYYETFPEAALSFRYDYQIAPIIILVYFMFNWVAINEIIKSRYVYEKHEIIIKSSVLIGTFIALYSLYGSIFVGLLNFPDFIKMLPDLIQHTGDHAGYGIRSTGFSQEPSFYVLYQGWIVLFALHFKDFFSSQYLRIVIIAINIVALLLTMSSTLSAFFMVIFLYLLVKNTMTVKRFIIFISITVIVIFIISAVLNYNGLLEAFNYAFYYKVENFFSSHDHTLDSGAFRNYTSRLGVEIFKDFPIFGVGPGCSNFFMHLYEKNIYIVAFGERLTEGSFPQSSFTKILAEQGLFGFIFFMSFFGKAIYSFYLSIQQYDEMAPFFLGGCFTFLSLMSISPPHSMFIYVYIALGLNIIKFRKMYVKNCY